jgi:hypothetical protein
VQRTSRRDGPPPLCLAGIRVASLVCHRSQPRGHHHRPCSGAMGREGRGDRGVVVILVATTDAARRWSRPQGWPPLLLRLCAEEHLHVCPWGACACEMRICGVDGDQPEAGRRRWRRHGGSDGGANTFLPEKDGRRRSGGKKEEGWRPRGGGERADGWRLGAMWNEEKSHDCASNRVWPHFAGRDA